MKCVINDQVVLSRAPEGPLAAHISSFAESFSAQGYALYSIRRQVRLAAGFSRWLEQKGVDVRCIASDHSSRYLRDRAWHVQLCRGDTAALRHLIDFLRADGVVPAKKVSVRRLTPAERFAQAYEQHVRKAQVLA